MVDGESVGRAQGHYAFMECAGGVACGRSGHGQRCVHAPVAHIAVVIDHRATERSAVFGQSACNAGVGVKPVGGAERIGPFFGNGVPPVGRDVQHIGVDSVVVDVAFRGVLIWDSTRLEHRQRKVVAAEGIRRRGREGGAFQRRPCRACSEIKTVAMYVHGAVCPI